MPAPAYSAFAVVLLASAFVVCFSQEQTRMILSGYYDSECLNPLPQTSHPNPQICAVGQCCSRSDGTTSLKLISCGERTLFPPPLPRPPPFHPHSAPSPSLTLDSGSHVNAVVYSDEKCETPIVKKSQLDGGIKLELKVCSPTSGIFFAPGSFYKADCVVSRFAAHSFTILLSIRPLMHFPFARNLRLR